MAKKKENTKLRKPLRELGKGGRYPEKTSINLYIVENRKRQNVISILCFAAFMTALALFTKFVIYEDINEINRLESAYNQRVGEISRMREATTDYERVRAEYSRYGNGYLNEEETAEQDRMAILDVIENELRPKEALIEIKISGNDAVLTINTLKLANVSEVVQNLERQDIVEYVSVSNAATQEKKTDPMMQSGAGDVTTQMTIHFRTPKAVEDLRAAREQEAAERGVNIRQKEETAETDAAPVTVTGEGAAAADGTPETQVSENGAAAAPENADTPAAPEQAQSAAEGEGAAG
ncbi:hypothetical protein [[Clostridium] aminophilum]|uniref:hypothetical protein n=1 Tax=[Clostridium] aminophilum TaxID=1526 RepID=UPI003320575C